MCLAGGGLQLRQGSEASDTNDEEGGDGCDANKHGRRAVHYVAYAGKWSDDGGEEIFHHVENGGGRACVGSSLLHGEGIG